MDNNKINEIQKQLGIIGNSESIKEIVKLILSVSKTDIPILILGESGSGKEVIAKAIHDLSPRSNAQLISVNCGAIPEGLIESELFGHEKGAFTGAISAKKGYFELADHGTIFLDEVGELPLQTQVKLLRVLETGIFMRVGGTQYKNVDVRVIAATNRELEKMIENKSFRMDLFYRLKGVQIKIPSLRERRDDIELLLHFFMDQYASEKKLKKPQLSNQAIDYLSRYNWPGNVRELKNIIETLFVLSGGNEISVSQVKEHLKMNEISDQFEPILPVITNKSVEQAERELIYRAIVSMGVEMSELKKVMGSFMQHIDRKLDFISEGKSFVDTDEMDDVLPMTELEKHAIVNALKKFRGNRKKVADKLEISERTLYRKIKEFGLENE